MLPVMHVDGLSHGVEHHEHVRLSQICDPSFDAPREVMVELTAEGCIIITDVFCQPIEHDNVFDDTSVVLHDDIVQVSAQCPQLGQKCRSSHEDCF